MKLQREAEERVDAARRRAEQEVAERVDRARREALSGTSLDAEPGEEPARVSDEAPPGEPGGTRYVGGRRLRTF